MKMRRDLFFMLGSLVTVNLLFAFGCIGLFTRMGPVIERILQENVYSIQAAEEMLVVLADSGPMEQRRKRFEKALKKLRNNITEREELPVLNAIEYNGARALGGDPGAVESIIPQIRKIIAINRNAMAEVDLEARRLGAAGAWSAVFLALISFTLSIVILRRIESKIILPMTELRSVLEDVRSGNKFRRCNLPGAPGDVRLVLSSVNRLLDDALMSSDSVKSEPESGSGESQ